MPPNPNPPSIQSAPVSPLDRFWLDTARESAKESVKALEEAAKQLITITSFAQTVYFAAVSFGDLKKAIDAIPAANQLALAFVLVLPLLLWIGSLILAIQVFKPETYQANLESPDDARETYYRIVGYKHRKLRQAHTMLVLGFFPLVLNIVFYIALAPVKPGT